ncbi:MAG: hypothetical protein HY720_09405 [Planctomycetes bacterium]|nr:hypothetical protein [Planctomycetota bacterium]
MKTRRPAATFAPLLALVALLPARAQDEPGIEGSWLDNKGRETWIAQRNGKLLCAYDWDSGTIVLSYQDGVFRGWWCETPTRQAPADAGQVEFRMFRRGDQPFLNGRWRYGESGEWQEDWDLEWVSRDIPKKGLSRFEEVDVFRDPPRPVDPGDPTDIEGSWLLSDGARRTWIVRRDGKLLCAYDWDSGTMVLSYQDGVYRGWWCETPSRKAPADAGQVEFRMARRGDQPFLDGRWRSGESGEWQEDWDLEWVSRDIPKEGLSRFEEVDVFRDPPRPVDPGDPTDIEGSWRLSDGGRETWIVRRDGKLFCAYDWDSGTMRLSYRDGHFVGWWSEAPTREPPSDAGQVEFRLVRREEDWVLDGRWRDGDSGDWHEDWDLTRVTRDISPDGEARLATSEDFAKFPAAESPGSGANVEPGHTPQAGGGRPSVPDAPGSGGEVEEDFPVLARPQPRKAPPPESFLRLDAPAGWSFQAMEGDSGSWVYFWAPEAPAGEARSSLRVQVYLVPGQSELEHLPEGELENLKEGVARHVGRQYPGSWKILRTESTTLSGHPSVRFEFEARERDGSTAVGGWVTYTCHRGVAFVLKAAISADDPSTRREEFERLEQSIRIP